MKAEWLVILSSCCWALGMYTVRPILPIYNRPEIYRGTWGTLFFTIVTAGITFGSISLLIWSFLNVKWYITILLVIGSLFVFALLYRFIPLIIRESAFGSIIAFVGFVILNYAAWSPEVNEADQLSAERCAMKYSPSKYPAHYKQCVDYARTSRLKDKQHIPQKTIPYSSYLERFYHCNKKYLRFQMRIHYQECLQKPTGPGLAIPKKIVNNCSFGFSSVSSLKECMQRSQ